MQPRGPRLMLASEIEALSPEQRWMSQPTRTIKAYFGEAKGDFERLIFILKPIKLRSRLKTWDFTSRDGNEAIDGTLEDPDEDYTSEQSASSPSSASDDDPSVDCSDEDLSDIADEEVAGLMSEAGAQATMGTAQNTHRRLQISAGQPPPDEEDTSPRTLKQRRQWGGFIPIYQRHHWPGDAFDEVACTKELIEWAAMAEARKNEEDAEKKEEALARALERSSWRDVKLSDESRHFMICLFCSASNLDSLEEEETDFTDDT